MASVHDVAEYILQKCGAMSTMKLQKLVYYSQAWSLVWDEDVLFPETIEAWANGPVSPALYAAHRGKYRVDVTDLQGDPSVLSPDQRETVDEVVKFYGDKQPQWLSDLTHSEAPWIHARKGLADGDRGSREISPASMSEYYGSL